ncbi:MAG: ABC transporter ATP-binding protein [Halobacteriales archaeon]
MPAIEARGLTKRYGDVVAVDDLDIAVDDEVFGFLGPNGAGKTTAIDLLLGFKLPTSGEAEVLGRPAGDTETRRRMGVLSEDIGVYPRLTGREHLEFAARSKQVDLDVDGLLERVGLDAGDRRAGGYSKGMEKRLALAVALVGQPDLLVLDEPTSGLDPNGARRMREIVEEENERGATVFFSSHVLGQVEAVCERVGIIQDGRMIQVDSIDGLRDGVHAAASLGVRVDRDIDAAADAARDVDGVVDVAVDGDAVEISCVDGRAKLKALDAVRTEAEALDVWTSERSLEDLFADYTEAG